MTTTMTSDDDDDDDDDDDGTTTAGHRCHHRHRRYHRDDGGATATTATATVVTTATAGRPYGRPYPYRDRCARPGDRWPAVTYTLMIRNNGARSAKGVTLTDDLPAGVTRGAVTTTQGSCGGTDPVGCNLGRIAKRRPGHRDRQRHPYGAGHDHQSGLGRREEERSECGEQLGLDRYHGRQRDQHDAVGSGESSVGRLRACEWGDRLS